MATHHLGCCVMEGSDICSYKDAGVLPSSLVWMLRSSISITKLTSTWFQSIRPLLTMECGKSIIACTALFWDLPYLLESLNLESPSCQSRVSFKHITQSAERLTNKRCGSNSESVSGSVWLSAWGFCSTGASEESGSVLTGLDILSTELLLFADTKDQCAVYDGYRKPFSFALQGA